MVSTYTTNKHIELPGNGDYVNTWNVPVNADMGVIDSALGSTISFNGTAGNQTLTNGVSDPYSYIPLFVKVTGALSANVTYTIPSGVGGTWVVYNTTTGGSYTVTFASAGGGASTAVARNVLTTIVSDGTNVYTASSSSVNGYARNNFTATAGQTTFAVTYTVGKLDVYINGVLLDPSDYTATNGTTVVLGVACTVGQPVSIMTY